MSENKKQKKDLPEEDKEDIINASEDIKDKEKTNEISAEEKLKISEEKLLRSLAEIENQRRRFEKEIKDAFEFRILIILQKKV